MKKFMKVCGIIALVLAVVGIVLSMIGFSVAGKKAVQELVSEVSNGNLTIKLPDINGSDWGVTIGEGISDAITDIVDSDVVIELDDEVIFDSDKSIIFQDVEKEDLGTDIKKFSIEVGGSAIAVEASEDEHFYLDAAGVGKFQYYSKGDELVLKASTGTIKLDELGAGKITLYVPKTGIESFEAEVGAGMLDLGELTVGELSIELGAGEVLADYLQADKCTISVGMGHAVIDDMDIEQLKAEVGAGEFVAEGNILKELNLDCAMGNVEVTLEGSEQDFDYELDAAMGNVSVGSRSYSGLGQQKSVDNDAEKTIDIECAMGNTTVSFTE